MNLPFEWLQFDFMHNALLAILMISPIFAFLGCLVVNNQMVFFSDAIGHAALTGIAIGTFVGMANPMGSMVVFSILLALGISLLRRIASNSTDTIIGLCMAFMVALGVVLLSRGGGFARYSKYLIGDILSINTGEIQLLLILLVVLVVLALFFFNAIFLVSINRSLAKSRGINVWLVEAIFSCLIAVIVTISIPWIGLMVINSLLILPAAASRNISRNTLQYVLISVLFSLISGVLGLFTSYYWSTATGATIVLFAMGFFILSLFTARLTARLGLSVSGRS